MILTLENLRMHCTECGDCMLWKRGLTSTGYPQVNIPGKGPGHVAKHVYTVLMGKQLNGGARVTTRCQNKLCVSPECLISLTPGQILARTYKTGRRSGWIESQRRTRNTMCKTKLTWPQVLDIRCRAANETHAAIAREFGVSACCIRAVRLGLSWRVPVARSVFDLGMAA